MIANKLSRISHFKFSIIKKFEYTLSEFVIMSSVTLIDEKRKWKKYLTEKWYNNIVNWLLNKKSQIKNKKYHLINIKNKWVLVYWERNEKWVCCIVKNEMKNVLWELHEIHDHYINYIMLKWVINQYFWSTRFADIKKHCFSCSNCQFIRLKLFMNKVLFITCLKFMNMWDLDYISFINFTL